MIVRALPLQWMIVLKWDIDARNLPRYMFRVAARCLSVARTEMTKLVETTLGSFKMSSAVLKELQDVVVDVRDPFCSPN